MTEVAPPVRRRLSDDAIEHLHSLMAGWQLIADLAFADLLLFLAVEGSESFRIVGQLRPYTARTLHPADLVGEVVEPTWHPYVERAWREGRRQRSLEPILIDAEPVRVETVPVRHQGEIVAVLSVESPETPARPTGRLEASYLGAAEALLEMVAAGTFPFVEAHDPTASPRVGDGLVVLDASGRVEFASPNATSAFRRMGTNALPLGQPLPHRAAILVAEAMAGGRPVESEIEAAGAVTDIRVVPLLRDSGNRGALVLVREATELRRLGRVISRREATTLKRWPPWRTRCAGSPRSRWSTRPSPRSSRARSTWPTWPGGWSGCWRARWAARTSTSSCTPPRCGWTRPWPPRWR
jgi:two-component system, sensor histidine kinase PdtaS